MPNNFDTQNTSLLRDRPDVAIRIISDGETVLEFDNNNLISVSLALRGVETKLDNPSLQASTIEIEAYYDGDINDLLKFRGKETIIQYKSAYDASGSNMWAEQNTRDQYIGIRAFYATFDEDGLQLEGNHIVRIKGTDNVGMLTGDGDHYLVLTPQYPTTTVGNQNIIYFKDIVRPHLDVLRGANRTDQRLTCKYDSMYEPNAYAVKNYRTSSSGNWIENPYYWLTSCIPTGNQRQRIAEWVNIFRGQKTQDPLADGTLYKRLVFRDAGSPIMYWTNNAINPRATSSSNNRFTLYSLNNPSNQQYYDIWFNNIWNIDYSQVSDINVEYGNSVSKVVLDNPYLLRKTVTEVFDVPVEVRSDSVLRHADAISTVITREKPSIYKSHTSSDWGTAGTPTITITPLSEKSFNIKIGSFYYRGTSPPKITITFDEAINQYDQTATKIPDIEISTGLSGDVINLAPIYALRYFGGSAGNPSYYLKYNIERVLAAGLKQPQWINFTWRGHPGMHPRDIILFTEKDGTQNYYEVDNLTLEHRDGGLTSRVKAILKYQKTT